MVWVNAVNTISRDLREIDGVHRRETDGDWVESWQCPVEITTAGLEIRVDRSRGQPAAAPRALARLLGHRTEGES